jgi:hypothetical protein
MGNNYGPKIVTDGLVLCLDAGNSKSYPGSGTDWFDLTGHDDFTIAGAYTYSSGPARINLNGVRVDNDSGSSPPSAWQGTTECTIDLWYRPQSMYGGCCPTIFGRYDFRFFHIGNNMYTMIGFHDGSGGRTYQHPSYSVAAGAWHHIVGMRRNSNYIIWIDGVERYNTTWGIGLSLYGANNQIWDVNSGSHDADYAVARIWNRGLSDAEILHNFNAQRARFGK